MNNINTIVFSKLNGILKENFNLKPYQNFGFNKQLALTLAANSEAQLGQPPVLWSRCLRKQDLNAPWAKQVIDVRFNELENIESE